MQVFLIRHGDAVPETLALTDAQRYLSFEGRVQARAIGDRLRWHDCTPTHIWTSPCVRAVQTAELVATAVESTVAVETLPALAPEDSPRAVLAALHRLPEDAIVLVVGHEPSLSAVGALLIGKLDFASLGKAQAARIVDGALRWRFAWNADAPESAPR